MHRVRDPKHPDFPHGKPSGRKLGCKCPPCEDAARVANKRSAYLRSTGRSSRRAAPEVFAKFKRHVETLIECGASGSEIARLAGVSHSAVHRSIHRGVVAPAVAAAVLAVHSSDLDTNKLYAPTARAEFYIRTMQALGYPVKWQCEQAKTTAPSKFLYTPEQSKISRPAFERLRALHERVGNEPATPANTGTTGQSISHAKAIARRAGWWPPAYYDDEGNLDHRSIPGHPWSVLDDACHALIEDLRLLIAHPGAGGGSIATSQNLTPGTAEHDATARRFDRLIEQAKISTLSPWGEFARAVLAHDIDVFDEEVGDPVTFVLDHGLRNPGWNLIKRDHPSVKDREDVAAWYAEAAEATTARAALKRAAKAVAA